MKSQLKHLGRKHSKKRKDQPQNLEHKHDDNDIPFADEEIQADSFGDPESLTPTDKENYSLNLPESKLKKKYSDLSPTNFVSSTKYASKITNGNVSIISSISYGYVSTFSSNVSGHFPTTSPNTNDSVPTISSNTSGTVPTISSNTIGNIPTISSNTIGNVPTISSNTIGNVPTISPNTIGNVSTISPNTIGNIPTISSNTIGNVPTISPNTIGNVSTILPNTNGTVHTISPNIIGNVPTISPNTSGNVPTISSNIIGNVPTISPNTIGNVPTILPNTNGNVPTISSNTSGNVLTISPNINGYVPSSFNSVTMYIHSDLHNSSVHCSKYHMHDHFIPVDALDVNHFPENFRKPCWSKFIKLKAIDVVHLIVNYTSENRPDELGFKGTKTARHGTGTTFLYNMDKTEKCDCKAVKSVHFVSGLFRVFTASHVVFDDEEAKNTTVEFFYDSADLSTVVKGWGVRVCHVDVKKNRSIIECQTHDVSLCQRLRDAQRKRNELLKEELHTEVGAHQMVVLISHPHGLCKQVSFGTLKEKNITGESRVTKEGVKLVDCTLTYDTPSCPGAGGGPVNVIGGGTPSYAFAPHLACKGNGENVSGVGWTRINNE